MPHPFGVSGRRAGSDKASHRQGPIEPPMKFAFSTNAYMRYPFEEAAARIAEIGYSGLELMADVPHAWPAGLLSGPKKAIREAMSRHGLTFSNVNAFMM